MPTISIFIRKDDLPKWQSLENKSAWLHNALEDTASFDKLKDIVDDRTVVVQIPEKNIKTTNYGDFVPKPPDPETGYPCCQGSTPCKHWHFDGDRQLWKNEITGKTKEPGAGA